MARLGCLGFGHTSNVARIGSAWPVNFNSTPDRITLGRGEARDGLARTAGRRKVSCGTAAACGRLRRAQQQAVPVIWLGFSAVMGGATVQSGTGTRPSWVAIPSLE
jgi:hypothetical protein